MDPTACKPKAEVVATFPTSELNGIAAIAYDKYAIIGGDPTFVNGNSEYANETIFTIDFSSNTTAANQTIKTVATLTDAVFLNG